MNRSFLALVLFPALASAKTDVDGQGWLQIAANLRTKSGWRFLAELQPRFGEDFNRPVQFLARGAVGRQVTRNLSLWGGYAWTPQFQPIYRSEDRPFLQSLLEHRVGRTRLVNRTRLEFRGIEGAGAVSVRARHLFRTLTPFSNRAPLSAIVWDEVFWNVSNTSTGPERGFDQNRLFAGLGYQMNKTTRFELGYMVVNQSIARSERSRRLDVLNFVINLDF